MIFSKDANDFMSIHFTGFLNQFNNNHNYEVIVKMNSDVFLELEQYIIKIDKDNKHQVHSAKCILKSIFGLKCHEEAYRNDILQNEFKYFNRLFNKLVRKDK